MAEALSNDQIKGPVVDNSGAEVNSFVQVWSCIVKQIVVLI